MVQKTGQKAQHQTDLEQPQTGAAVNAAETAVQQPQTDLDKAQEGVAENVKVTTDKVRTRGWWVFDFIGHFVINTVVNIALSVLMVIDRANHKHNKTLEGDKKNGFNVEASEEDKAKGPKKVRLAKFYEFSDWLDTQFYNKDKNGDVDQTPKGQGFREGANKLQKAGGIFGWIEDKGGDKIPGLKHLWKPLGKYTPGILFLAWGGHLTNMLMWALETPKVKPKLVRALDKMIDGVRSVFGKGPTAEELESRQAIYQKLDSDLAGKSFKGVWGARFAGIGTIIGVASVAEAVDVGIAKNSAEKNGTEFDKDKARGLLRISSGFFNVMKYHKGGMEAMGKKFDRPYLSDDPNSLAAKRAEDIAGGTVVEIAGTSITAFTQYVYLMARELFGVGPKTNLGDKNDKDPKSKKEKIKAAKSKAMEGVTKIPPAPVVHLSTSDRADKPGASVDTNARTNEKREPVRYAEKNRPAAATYGDKARVAAEAAELQPLTGQVV